MKGIIAMLFSLGGFLVGLGVAYFFYDPTALWLQPYVHTKVLYLQIAAFLLLWLCTMLCMAFIGQLLTSLMRVLQLGFLNRLGGALLGFAKVFGILTVVLMLCAKLNLFCEARATSQGSAFMEAFGKAFWTEVKKAT